MGSYDTLDWGGLIEEHEELPAKIKRVGCVLIPVLIAAFVIVAWVVTECGKVRGW